MQAPMGPSRWPILGFWGESQNNLPKAPTPPQTSNTCSPAGPPHWHEIQAKALKALEALEVTKPKHD